MAYDEDLANRIRELIADEPNLTEQAMFGGLAFLIGGNMSVAASGQGGLMVRLDADEAERLLERDSVRPFEMRGKPMKGWLRVDDAGFESDEQLREWVELSVEFARTLPHK
jgi:TfoX/Sxy family transcriptional regulator of competence genes